MPSWFRKIAVLERTATDLTEFQPLVVPGLLQTEHYATASIGAGALAPRDLDSVVKSRLERRANLLDGVRLRFLISEAAIRTTVGTAGIMAEQVRQLITLAEQDVRIGVLPDDIPQHPARVPALRLMSFADRPRLGYVEHALGGDLVDEEELISRLDVLMSAVLAEALSPKASIDLLRKVAADFDALA
ncbi:hypothetical protein CLV63_113167 [Murinocardiopsis flavida]|uniref:DUF5753 domain-containing protein n=2 Tax=Murinocardiopsis flavida TaxID=645275 RepID=A0A2P8DFK5_9ACTN|nr:hypothetical protein CLV63_113167 [Murinocardiopsis flavida]